MKTILYIVILNFLSGCVHNLDDSLSNQSWIELYQHTLNENELIQQDDKVDDKSILIYLITHGRECENTRVEENPYVNKLLDSNYIKDDYDYLLSSTYVFKQLYCKQIEDYRISLLLKSLNNYNNTDSFSSYLSSYYHLLKSDYENFIILLNQANNRIGFDHYEDKLKNYIYDYCIQNFDNTLFCYVNSYYYDTALDFYLKLSLTIDSESVISVFNKNPYPKKEISYMANRMEEKSSRVPTKIAGNSIQLKYLGGVPESNKVLELKKRFNYYQELSNKTNGKIGEIGLLNFLKDIHINGEYNALIKLN